MPDTLAVMHYSARATVALILCAAMSPWFATANAAAQSSGLVHGSADLLDTAIPGHSRLTWGAALKLMLPDVHPGTDDSIEATTLAKARRLDSADEVAADGALHATWLSARDVTEAGQARLLVFAEVDQSLSDRPGSALLALIDPAPQPRLLDLVDVGDDRENSLLSSPALKIGANSDLVMISSSHFNSNEEYAIRTALFVDRDHFDTVASVFLLSSKFCGYERAQTADFVTRPKPGAEFASLDITVTEHAKRTTEDCDSAPRAKSGVTTWRATFDWNPAKRAFTTQSRALDALAKHNEKDS